MYSEYSFSGTSVSERIYAMVKNAAWSATPTNVLVNAASYPATSFQQNYPVLTYNDGAAKTITVGWMTQNNTIVIPGTADIKYVAQNVMDPGTAAPTSVASSYMMISNTKAGPAPVLAFSGQNLSSSFNGLHTAFSLYNVIAPGEFGLYYKDKPWSSATFKVTDENSIMTGMSVSVDPNPFINILSLTAPVKGLYTVLLYSMEGRVVYEKEQLLETGGKLDVNTELFIPGMYLLKVASAENNIDYTHKLVK